MLCWQIRKERFVSMQAQQHGTHTKAARSTQGSTKQHHAMQPAAASCKYCLRVCHRHVAFTGGCLVHFAGKTTGANNVVCAHTSNL